MMSVLAFVLLLGYSTAHALIENSTGYSVLVFGDSWGDTGPTYHEVQDTLDRHGVRATVLSTAVGGTTACGWAQDEMALVKAAKDKFPDLHDGPDFVWYTLGGNDLAYSQPLRVCAKNAKHFDEMVSCIQAVAEIVKGCTNSLLKSFWQVFPKAHVMHSGYDLPCESVICDATVSGSFDAGWCGNNHTCLNTLMEHWHHLYVDALVAKLPQTQYAGLNILGACQKAGGVPGADVGKPVLTQGSPCQWEVYCIHPKYGTPAATAVGEAMWDQYFSKHMQSNNSSGADHHIMI